MKLQTYINTEEIQATKMTRQEAVKHHLTLSLFNYDEEGYFIEHANGKQRWCSEGEFENTYRLKEPSGINTDLKTVVDPDNECCCLYCLAHKCKEWAWENHHVRFESGRLFGTVAIRYNCIIDACQGTKFCYGGDCIVKEASTEPEAIFKATQYMLDNLKEITVN